jgi:uncharacterized protein YyaL (SSP411 family)
MENKTNRLINEKSPYLLQHARNPVDWHPWGEEAFDLAQREDRPIFLSIGYSTCHWCHVMAHECFEDEAVAALMNRAFISLKVDREERPDLDHIYMTVCQMLTGSGGWPLTIIMTPDKRPFFAGTYIPKNNRFGRMGLIELIPRIQEVWTKGRRNVMDSADQVIAVLKNLEEPAPGRDPGVSVLDKAYNELARSFDSSYGGFGTAPKFPSPHNLLFLLRQWNRTGSHDALVMVEQTVRAMRQGGIYDQIGFGFHRYSTDREWLVPHFEKMLYDQALIAVACLEVYQASSDQSYAQIAREIFTYVLRDMTSPEGGFYSAEDADSEGEEGKFYLWGEKEIFDILGKADGELLMRFFSMKKEGNFRDESAGRTTGLNIPHIKSHLTKTAEDHKLSARAIEEKINSLRGLLFNARESRPHPYKDDKILTDWNGLMIAALAKGAQVLEDQACLEAAIKAAGFILDRLREPDGRLLHRFRDGEAGITANLDDYAFFIWGLLELYEASFDAAYLKAALELNKDMISLFWDSEKGGLFFTPKDGEKLLIRKKEAHDAAVPSGNAVAMLNMLRLARFTGRPDLDEKAAEIGRAFSAQIEQMPSAHSFFMTAIDFAQGPAYEVVISGNSKNRDTIEMISALRRNFIPSKTVMLRPAEIAEPSIDSLAEFVKGHSIIDQKATAYVCLKNACKTPTTDPMEMLKLLGVSK